MAMSCTAPHLKYIKGKKNKLVAGKAGEMTFCLLRRKGSRDVILHFDEKAAPAKYKNPATIHRIFMKTTRFAYRGGDSSFFDDISKVISMTGTVSFAGGTATFQKQLGRAGKADLQIACTDLKLPRFELVDSVEISDTSESESLQTIRALRLDHLNEIAADPLGTFASLDELAALLEAANSIDSDNALFMLQRSALNTIYNAISDWSTDGIEGVSDAMTELGDIDDFDAEVAELEAFEAAAIDEMKANIQTLKDDSADLLRKKGFGDQFSSLKDNQKLLVTLSQGHFLLVESLKPTYGGGSLLLVNNTGNFSDLDDLIEEIRVGAPPATGRFKKSKSKKKIAFISGRTRKHFKSAISEMGLPMTVYIVSNFDSLQSELQNQKAEVQKEDSIADIKAKLISAPPNIGLQPILEADTHTELLKQYYAHLLKGSGAESLGFALCVGGRSGLLESKHQLTSNADIYDRYVKDGATYMINIDSTNRSRAKELFDASGADSAAFAKHLAFIRKKDSMLTQLLKSELVNFSTSEILATTLYDQPRLAAVLSVQL